jgi:hypothetical protein
MATGNEVYKTSDLYFGAFLRSAGCNQIKVERDGPRCFFVFENTDAILRLRADYYNGKAKICPLTFANNIRALKSVLHAEN